MTFYAYVEGDMNTQARYSEPVDKEFTSRYHRGYRSTTKGGGLVCLVTYTRMYV